jgi:predicted restriction endonuclease
MPLAPGRYKLQLTISGETYETLQRVQALLRHTFPDGDLATIVDRALTTLLDDLERRRSAAVGTPRESPRPNERSRHIPAAVRREVWRRDGGRCAFVGRSGRRCTERAFLEFHHVQPYADAGQATVANIQLRCRAHNAHEARLLFDQPAGVREPRPRFGTA